MVVDIDGSLSTKSGFELEKGGLNEKGLDRKSLFFTFLSDDFVKQNSKLAMLPFFSFVLHLESGRDQWQTR